VANISSFFRSLQARLWRLVTTPYHPAPACDSFVPRAQTQEQPRAAVTVAVLTGSEAKTLFGVDLARRGIQPVFVRIENHGTESMRLQLVNIDPKYFTPLEAAAVTHFSIGRRLSAFGTMGWVFVPLLALVPLKLVTAYLANGRMDEFFRARGFPLASIPPGGAAEGFVFTTLDLGTKSVHVRLGRAGGLRQAFGRLVHPAAQPTVPPDDVEFVFTVPVPGIAADYLDRDFDTIRPPSSVEACDRRHARLAAGGVAAGDDQRRRHAAGRPGEPRRDRRVRDAARGLRRPLGRERDDHAGHLLEDGEGISARRSNYRYSPVSPLHLFGRDQDIALQRTRHSINERLHLRLWLTPLTFEGRPVWAGQVSRDIGVRFTTQAWNLTTHRIDPNVDESRDYVIEDLAQARRVAAAGYVGGWAAARPRRPSETSRAIRISPTASGR
jgi:hypothetical protein